jgi:hypothetical protein
MSIMNKKQDLKSESSGLNLHLSVRNGLFLASSRTYAEQYIEPLIREKFGLLEPKDDDYDAIDLNHVKYEIKASKVLRESKNTKANKTLLERILFENSNVELNRLVKFSEAETASYLANIQNVKRDHFSKMYYVLLFEDCIKIFLIDSRDIRKGNVPSWSDKHGRYDAPGKSGQFPITKATIGQHLEKYLVETMTYQEAASIFQKLSK